MTRFKHLPHYNLDIGSGAMVEQRVGEPTALEAALGCAVWRFADLEDEVDNGIAFLAGAGQRESAILLSELSFRSKVPVLAALVREAAATRRFNVGDADPNEFFHELVVVCLKAEELRNGLVHSRWEWPGSPSPRHLTRVKTTVRPKRGLHTSTEVLTADHIMDMGDFFVCVAHDLSEFFIDPSTP